MIIIMLYTSRTSNDMNIQARFARNNNHGVTRTAEQEGR